MTSALESRPKLRDDLKIVRREHRGEVHYIVKYPDEDQFYRFGETEVGLMRLMDGRRTPADISDAAADTLGVRPPPGQLADFAHKLKRLGLVERTPAEQHLILMERLRSQRKLRAGRRTRGSILRLRFSIGDPDRLFDWIVKRIAWMWSPGFVAVSLLVFGVYGIILAARWGEFWSGTVGIYTLRGFGLWDWVLLYGLVLAIGVIHELGHGLTIKAFGGEVHEAGAMMLYFQPAFYVNTNDAWTFQRRAHRLWVNFAGPWIELFVTGLAAIAWVTTEPGSFAHWVAFLTLLIGGIVAVLTNLNPLLPLDGYYALSDWLEIPNLRRRAFGYWSWLSKRFLLGIKVAPPVTTPRERRIFLIYGGLAIAYSAFVLVISLVWLIFVIGRFIGPWVWVIIALIMARLAIRLGGRWQALALAATTTWRAGFLRSGRAAAVLAAALLVLGLPFILPWTFRARGEFRIEAMPRALVRAEVEGVLDRWHVREGEAVDAGDPIATLFNPELESAFLDRQARADRLAVSRARAEAQGDRVTAASTSAVLEKVLDELTVLRAQRSRLIVRAPIDGIVLGYRLWEQLGVALRSGDLLVEVAPPEGRYARIRVPMKKAGELAPGQRVSLKLFARPDFKFITQVSSVAPAGANGCLEAGVFLPNGPWQPAPGMTGIAKIATRRGTVAQAITRAVRQTIRIDLWL